MPRNQRLPRSSITTRAYRQFRRFSDVQSSPAGIVWRESISDDTNFMHQSPTGKLRSFSLSPKASGGLFYGGGEFTLSQNSVIFTDKQGRVYRRDLDGDTQTNLSPAFGLSAHPCPSPDNSAVLFIHQVDDQDCIAVIHGKSWGYPIRLIHGADFYMQPTWHPSSRRIAWVEWDFPQMPWEGCWLKSAEVDVSAHKVLNVQTHAGGSEIPVFQPSYSPDGRWLAYLENSGEWDDLVLEEVPTGGRRILLPNSALIPPAWLQGMRGIAWRFDSQSLYVIRSNQAASSIVEVSLDGSNRTIPLPPYNNFTQISALHTGPGFVCLAASPHSPPVVLLWDGAMRVVRDAGASVLHTQDLPTPREVSWTAEDGRLVHGVYYPPTNPALVRRGLPPAIVHAHSGPTRQVSADFSFDTAYFTSRGFAFLAVNYRGSTGYGREYRQALNMGWGKIDVADIISGARFLIREGLADPDRLAVKGSSAGGYTVLNAIIREPTLFKAAICAFGVTHLKDIIAETIKFERCYYDSLVGPLPEYEQRYQDWSPLTHAASIRTPLAVFHGSEDPVVPLTQAHRLVEILNDQHIPHLFKVYYGEGHGWRRSSTMQDYYRKMEQFLCQYVLQP